MTCLGGHTDPGGGHVDLVELSKGFIWLSFCCSLYKEVVQVLAVAMLS